MKLTDRDVSFLKLLMRSPDRGDGWRRVSAVVWGLVETFGRKELLETEEAPAGEGLVRLSERGAVVIDYI